MRGKNIDQSQHTSRSGKCTLDLEKFRRDFRKDQKDLMKGEDLTLLAQTTQLTNTPSYREKYTKSQPLHCISYILVRSKTLWSRITLYRASTARLGCQHFDSTDWFSVVKTRAPADICEQWERNLTTHFSRRL